MYYMNGNIHQLNALTVNDLKSSFYDADTASSGIYMGAEHRNDRRRVNKSERVELMIKNFGLERRMRTERRKEATSWLLISSMVVNQ